jgi:hypothetical protein
MSPHWVLQSDFFNPYHIYRILDCEFHIIKNKMYYLLQNLVLVEMYIFWNIFLYYTFNKVQGNFIYDVYAR